MKYKLNNGEKINKKPSYQDGLKTVNPDFINKNYDLETAYDNLPFELLEAGRKNPEDNHLPSGVELPNGNGQYLKSPLHKSYFLENAWQMTKEGKEGKQKYIGDKKFPFETLILKGQHGILTPWYKAYNSKFGKGVRNLMLGKDYDLSDEEYVQKHGYAKPITGTGMLPGKTSMNPFEGVENLVQGSFGTGARYNAQLHKTEAAAFKALEKHKIARELDERAIKGTGKHYDELSSSEQYFLKLLKK